MKSITDIELENRVKGYLSRTGLPKYDLEREGRYAIMGGARDGLSSRQQISVVEGRFIDALVYAVQEVKFLGDWCSWVPYDNCNHGEIYALKIRKSAKSKRIDNLLEKLKGDHEK